MKCAMEMAMMVAEKAMLEEQKKREQAEEARREREQALNMAMKANFIKHIDEITNILETALLKGNGKASILLKKEKWFVGNAVSFIKPRYGSLHSFPVDFEDLIQSRRDNVVSLLDIVEFLKQHCYTVSWKQLDFLTFSWSGESTFHNDVIYLDVSI